MSTTTVAAAKMTKKQMIANAEKKGIKVSSSEKKEVIWEKISKEEREAEEGVKFNGEY